MAEAANVVNLNTAGGLEVAGRSIPLRPDGRLQNLDDWSPEVAEALARESGLDMTEDHWTVVNLMRSYYQEYNVSPVRKLLKRALRSAGHKALAEDERLDALFPGDVMVQGSRIAGIPTPHLDAELERRTYANTKARAAGDSTHFTGSFEFEGKTYEVTPTGNLVNQSGWNERLAEFLAEKEGIELTREHWEVLNFLREFYFEFGITPMVKILMKHMAEELGPEKASRDYLYRLFPKGPSRQGSRIAGLPEPQGCIDG